MLLCVLGQAIWNEDSLTHLSEWNLSKCTIYSCISQLQTCSLECHLSGTSCILKNSFLMDLMSFFLHTRPMSRYFTLIQRRWSSTQIKNANKSKPLSLPVAWLALVVFVDDYLGNRQDHILGKMTFNKITTKLVEWYGEVMHVSYGCGCSSKSRVCQYRGNDIHCTVASQNIWQVPRPAQSASSFWNDGSCSNCVGLLVCHG